MRRNLERWIDDAPRIECDWEPLKATYRRSLVDLAALRFSPPIAGGRSLPAAGLPWFMTMFGRDSIFTSLQALPFTPELAATTLRALGDWQGVRLDDFRDEDPGRILHEMRYGEMTAFEERPHSPYYGAVDATPLYVVLLDEYERWTGTARSSASSRSRRVLRSTGSTSTRISWATGTSGTAVETRRPGSRTSAGRTPGIRSRSATARCPASRGRRASSRGTRTTRRCVAPASRARSGRTRELADTLERDAADLKRRFNRDYWVEDGEYFAIALDEKGRQVDCALVEQRPPAVERHRRQDEGEGGRAPPPRTAALLGLGRAHARRGRRALQPDRLPHRHRLAVRQLVHRLGPPALRLQGRGCGDRRGHPRRRRVLRRPPARGVRRLPAAADEVPGAVSDRVQPAGVVDGNAAPPPADDARARAVRRPSRRRSRAAERHRPSRSCSTSPAAGAAWTPSVAGASTFGDGRRGGSSSVEPARGRRPRAAAARPRSPSGTTGPRATASRAVPRRRSRSSPSAGAPARPGR